MKQPRSSSASERSAHGSADAGRGNDTFRRHATHQRRERLQKEVERVELRWARENRLA
jgi:hypothetical protein